MTQKRVLFSDSEIARLRSLFQEFDSDKSGSITDSEAKQCLKKYGTKLDDSEIDDLLAQYDSNNSGSIEFVEFLKLCGTAFQNEKAKKTRELETPPHPKEITPIYVFIGGNTNHKYLNMTAKAVRFLKRSMPDAAVGIIYPPGTFELEGDLTEAIAAIDSNVNTENIHYVEGQKHFDDWGNIQHILDIQIFAEEFDPVIFLDSDSAALRNVSGYVEEFKNSGKKFGLLADFLIDYPNFKKNWVGKQPPFVPQQTFMLFRSAYLADFIPIWERNWKDWIEPAPFVKKKDPAHYYTYSRLSIAKYALGESLYEYLPDFKSDVKIIPRNELKLLRNFELDAEKVKAKFLLAGSSYSNEGEGKVTVVVQSGKVYRKQDITGVGDPFVTVKVGDFESKTKVIKNTQDPVWNEEFVFDDSSYGEADNIFFTLWDWDRFTKNDLIGTASLSLIGEKTNEFGSNVRHYTVPVKDKEDVEQGTIEVDAEFFVDVLRDDDDDGAIKSRDFTGDEAQTVIINVKDGEIYKKHDVVGDDDPYVIIDVGGLKKQTDVIENTQNPKWNQEFTWEDIPNGAVQNVQFTLYDKDKFTKDDLIGTGVLDLSEFRNNETSSVSVALYDPQGEKQATIDLDVLVKTGGGGQQQPAGDDSPPPPTPPSSAPLSPPSPQHDPEPEPEPEPVTTRDFFPTATASAVNVPQKYGTVTFFIREGKVAHSHDVLGKGDPYVVVRVAGATKQTVAKMNTKTPRWNEKLIFDDIPFSTDEAEIQMWDKDVATKDDFIGSTIYNLTQAKDKKQIEKAFKLLEKNKSAATV